MALHLPQTTSFQLRALLTDAHSASRPRQFSASQGHVWPFPTRSLGIATAPCSHSFCIHSRLRPTHHHGRGVCRNLRDSRLTVSAVSGNGNDEGKSEPEVEHERADGEGQGGADPEKGRGGEGGLEETGEPQLSEYIELFSMDDKQFSSAVSNLLAQSVQYWDFYDVNGDPVEMLDLAMVHTYLKCGGWALGSELVGVDIDTTSAKYVDWILERELRSEVFDRSNFSVSYAEPGMGGERVFFGEFTGDSTQAVAQLEERLSRKFPDLVLTVTEEVIGNSLSSDIAFTAACRIHHKWMLIAPQRLGVPVSLLSLLLCVLGVNGLPVPDSSNLSASGQLWNGMLLLLGILSTFLASSLAQSAVLLGYKCRPPFFFCPLPAPNFGILASVWDARGYLPSRASSIDQALASTTASLVASFALLAAPAVPVPPYLEMLTSLFGVKEHESALAGVLLVPASTFDYSSVLTEIATRLSVATLPGSGGEFLLALSPLTLAGVLGLNMTILSLLPFGCSNGGLILSGIFGGTIAVPVTAGLTAGLVIVFFLSNIHSFWLSFGFGLALLAGSNPDNRIRDSYTFPGFIRSVCGAAAVATALGVLLPASVLGRLLPGGVASVFEMVDTL